MKTAMVLASVLALAACDSGGNKGGDGAKAEATGEGDTKSAAAAEAIPVEEDFEEEAQKEISADNLDEQVSELEAEIEGG